MSDLVTRLRAEVDEDVNEPLDRLLDEAARRIEQLERWQEQVRDGSARLRRVEALEGLIAASRDLGPWIAASVDAPDAGAAYVADASAFLEVLAKVDVP